MKLLLSPLILFLLLSCVKEAEDCGCGVITDTIQEDIIRRDLCSDRLDTIDLIVSSGWSIGDTVCDLKILDETKEKPS